MSRLVLRLLHDINFILCKGAVRPKTKLDTNVCLVDQQTLDTRFQLDKAKG
jgi:hypothetical protein